VFLSLLSSIIVQSQRCSLFSSGIMLLGKSTGTVVASYSVHCLMPLLVCIFWNSKNFTYKCNILLVINCHLTMVWPHLIYDGCFETRVFLVDRVFWFLLLVDWFCGVFFSHTETFTAKNSVLITDHLKWILDHVGNDELLRKAQRKLTLVEK